jgi:hypothetical protein
MTTVLAVRVRVLGDGTAPVTIRCDYSRDCAGALLIGSDSPESNLNPCQGTRAVAGARNAGWWAQSDLAVPAGVTRTIGVVLSSCARQLLRQKRALDAVVTADTERDIPQSELPNWDGVVITAVTLIAP